MGHWFRREAAKPEKEEEKSENGGFGWGNRKRRAGDNLTRGVITPDFQR